MYDVTSREFFEKVYEWLQDFYESGYSEDSMLMLLANKTDDKENRKVSWEEGNLLAKKYGMLFTGNKC